MKHYQAFHFSGYSWNHHAGKISLRYALDSDISFEETLVLPERVTDERLKEKEWQIERALFALHLIGGISYFKTTLPRSIVIESGKLGKKEVKFWNAVYEHGLGEFFYRNDIDYRGLVNFPLNERLGVHEEPKKQEFARTQDHTQREQVPRRRVLVPIGGGKDSMVTIEVLKKAGAQVTLLRLNGDPIIDELAATAGLPLLNVKRTPSENLFKLNTEGALNGHVPITAYLSMLSVLIALLYDFDAVAMSSERSASEGNVEFKGMIVNHQWSKSLEFEKLFRRYIAESIVDGVEYFSALRPYSELWIAKAFAQYPQYFLRTTSCNKNWKMKNSPLPRQSGGTGGGGRWCSTCPKCAFVFALLAAYLDRATLQAIFGSILFEDESLLPLYRELLGLEKFKPFECVGTPEETAAAFLLARERGDLRDTAVMKMFEVEALQRIKNPKALIAEVLEPSTEHCIPSHFNVL